MFLHAIRRNLPRLGRFHAALFVVLWATMAATPCVMAMQGEPEPSRTHDCPHCPPKPCHELASPAECDTPEPADRLRSVDASQFAAALPAGAIGIAEDRPLRSAVPSATGQRCRAGPRPHLLHLRFDE